MTGPFGSVTLDQRARELGRQIGQSAEYQGLKRANDGLNADVDAVALLRRMEELRLMAQHIIQRGEEPGPEMEQELDGLLTKTQVSPAYQRAITAQENFDKVMVQVNSWISEGIRSGATSSIITLG